LGLECGNHFGRQRTHNTVNMEIINIKEHNKVLKLIQQFLVESKIKFPELEQCIDKYIEILSNPIDMTNEAIEYQIEVVNASPEFIKNIMVDFLQRKLDKLKDL